ncbi:MAG TPA: helix-turn-helix domain-containing protein, partial [Gemmatimonadaceae bacterium]
PEAGRLPARRCTRHLHQVQYSELPPPPALSAVIRCFWFLRGDFPPCETQTVVADGRLEIILHLANPFSRLDPPVLASRQDAVLVSGQLTGPIHLQSNGYADVVGIRFRTTGAKALLRVPLGELTDRVDSLAPISRRMAAALHAAAAGTADLPSRARALSAVLSRHADGWIDPLARAAISQLDAPHGPTVARTARSLGTTSRTLERRVLNATGLSPAALRRVLRFRRAFRLLDASPRGSWAGVAGSAGYHDQAHLIRDFRQFAGVSPTEFFHVEPELARAIMTGGDGGGA